MFRISDALRPLTPGDSASEIVTTAVCAGPRRDPEECIHPSRLFVDFWAWPFSVKLLVKISHFLGSLHWPVEAGVGAWPCSVGLLVKISDFLVCLHSNVDADIWVVGGVSHHGLLILFERWAGERLVLEKGVPTCRRAGRPISVSAVPLGLGTVIWRACRFLGSVLRFLDRLLDGLGRFCALQDWC